MKVRRLRKKMNESEGNKDEITKSRSGRNDDKNKSIQGL
jgi:hypothetical protein